MGKCLYCGTSTENMFCSDKCQGGYSTLGTDGSKPTIESKVSNSAMENQVGGDHYKKHAIQPWHIIDDYKLDFYLGNALKYLIRDKSNQEEDLGKAIHYLERKLELLKENPKQGSLELGDEVIEYKVNINHE